MTLLISESRPIFFETAGGVPRIMRPRVFMRDWDKGENVEAGKSVKDRDNNKENKI